MYKNIHRKRPTTTEACNRYGSGKIQFCSVCIRYSDYLDPFIYRTAFHVSSQLPLMNSIKENSVFSNNFGYTNFHKRSKVFIFV